MTTLFTRRHRLAAALPLAAFCTSFSATLAFADGTVPPPPAPFSVHWAVSEAGQATNLNLRGSGIERNVIHFSKDSIGTFPKAGPHMIELYPGGREAFYTEHMRMIEHYLRYIVPDTNWNGIGVIDYEYWAPFWSKHPNTPSTAPFDAEDEDWTEDWKDYIREHRPGLLAGLSTQQQEQVFKDTWLAAGREFFTRTIREAKRLRPNATWGFYNLPDNPYWPWVSTYGPHPAARIAYEARNSDETAWVADEVDAFFPCFYTHYETRDPWHHTMRDANGRGTDSLEMNDAYFRVSMEEYRAVAGGKPIIPFVWYYYHTGQMAYGGNFVAPFNFERSITLPQQYGARGVVIWGWTPNTTERQRVQTWADTNIFPFVSEFLTDLERRRTPAPPPQPPTPVDPPEPPPVDDPPGGSSGGSGGGGSGGGGSGGGSGGPVVPVDPPAPSGGGDPPPPPPAPPANPDVPPAPPAPPVVPPDPSGVQTVVNPPAPPAGGGSGPSQPPDQSPDPAPRSGGSGLYGGGSSGGSGSSGGGSGGGSGIYGGGAPVIAPPPVAPPAVQPAPVVMPPSGSGEVPAQGSSSAGSSASSGSSGSVAAPWLRRNNAAASTQRGSALSRLGSRSTTVVAPPSGASNSASSPAPSSSGSASTSSGSTSRIVSPTGAVQRTTTPRVSRGFAPARETINAAIRRSQSGTQSGGQ